MITCRQCGCEYLSVRRESYPGAARTGATIAVSAAIRLPVGLALAGLGLAIHQGILYLFAGSIFILALLEVASIPENNQIVVAHRGHECPQCGAANALHWYD